MMSFSGFKKLDPMYLGKLDAPSKEELDAWDAWVQPRKPRTLPALWPFTDGTERFPEPSGWCAILTGLTSLVAYWLSLHPGPVVFFAVVWFAMELVERSLPNMSRISRPPTNVYYTGTIGHTGNK